MNVSLLVYPKNMSTSQINNIADNNKDVTCDIADQLLDCDTDLLTIVSFYENQKEIFKNVIINFLNTNTILHSSILAKILACCLGMADKELSILLCDNQMYKLPEILKTCQILDSRRYLKQLKLKLENKSNSKKIGFVQSEINNISQLNLNYDKFSLTKSKIKMIKQLWVNKIPANKLEFYALSYDLNIWKDLANLLHLKSEDFQLNWFLKYVYGTEPPNDTIVFACRNISAITPLETIMEIVIKYKPSYNFIRNSKMVLSGSVLSVIASYTDINTLLWWLHEFAVSNDSLEIIQNKINKEDVSLPYGVLIDKLFLSKKMCTNVAKTNPYQIKSNFGWQNKVNNQSLETYEINRSHPMAKIYEKLLPIAEEQLKKYMLNFGERKVAIFGDASGSMEIAIKTSSIVSSILCTICNAKLHLFTNVNNHIKECPKDVKDVVKFNETCKARGGTAPASSLEFYYSTDQKIDVIFLVTDEEENGVCKNMKFSEMFDKYCKKHNFIPKLVFISFLNKGNKGQMISEFYNKYPQYTEYIYQYIFDKSKPDLSKLDSVLNKISTI